MVSKELIEKINYLWRKQKTTGLSEAEKEEQKLAREQYLEGIRTQVRGMLGTIKEQQKESPENHAHDCGCKDCKH